MQKQFRDYLQLSEILFQKMFSSSGCHCNKESEQSNIIGAAGIDSYNNVSGVALGV
jgi:hypothetical protein